ncbi:uncharacterized protein TNCV_3765641, partial [Trichonephila clavipes]
PLRCVPLTATHCHLRLTWSREHALWTPQQWSCVMFSDESRFSLQCDSCQTLIWRVPGTRYHQENTIERHCYVVQDGFSRVWGGIILGSRTDFACSECNDDRPHLLGCHSGTTSHQSPPTCLPELRRAFLDEWCNIPQDQIDNLILSMPRRCKACIASSGRHTPY